MIRNAVHQRRVVAGFLVFTLFVIIAALYFLRAGKIDLTRGPVMEWPVYGQNDGGTRYSAIDQINRENVSLLEIAWEYHTGDFSDGSDGSQPTTFQATPILVDGVLYLSTVYGRVIALDPETGDELWTFDPKIDLSVSRGEFASRGVTAWLDPSRDVAALCRRRIFIATIDARLIALDAADGTPCEDFGQAGQVDLSLGVDLDDYQVDSREYGVTSPAVMIGDLVVVGSAIGDNRGVTLERGLVRAFNARTGILSWMWDPIPRDSDDPAWETWEDDSALRTGAANVWAQLSVDAERDLVFVPTSSPSPDYYGGERRGSNLYADSVVALRGSTGEVVWYYQIVHHNLWDYDLPAQPVLITVNKDGQEIPAVAQATKMGFLFVLHRETGEPLFPVEERPVPQTTVPGEESWPTQPFPILPPPLAPLMLDPDDAWGLTPLDRNQCRELIEAHRNEGIFTPPSLEGTIEYPGIVGGTNWGSLAFNPEHGLVVLNQSHIPFIVTLIPREQQESESGASFFNDMKGTPYLLTREPLLSPLELPCNKPPWGTVLAVDINSGEVKWEVPLGTISDLAPVPIPLEFGTPNIGGPIITAGDLVFIGAASENYLRAYDVETGEELWKGRLPAGGQATPMTYKLEENGRQFVIIAAGGHGRLGTTIGDSVVAFALPGSRTDLLIRTIKDVLYFVIPGLLIGFLLLRGRKILLNRWLWLVILAVSVIVSTELRWLMTQSATAMAVWFILALLVAYMLTRLRVYLADRWSD